jgi:transposase-like protein
MSDANTPELPLAITARWTVRRKAAVVQAVRNGSLTLDEVCKRYDICVEEFRAWKRDLDRHGLAGLRVTRLQAYRTDE